MRSQGLIEFDIWSNVDYVGLSIIIIIGILICILIIWLFHRFNKSSSNVMNEFSLRYNGEIIKGNSITGEQAGLTFKYNGFNITISSAYRSKGESSYTQVEATFHPIKEINLHLYSKSILNYLNQWFNIAETWKLEKIEIGFSDFDKFFTIKSNDGSLVNSILTINIQNNLINFKKYNPNVFIDKNVIKIWCPFAFSREQDYTGILDLIFLFCDRINELSLTKESKP